MLEREYLGDIEIFSSEKESNYKNFVIFVCGGGKTIGAGRFREWQEKLEDKGMGSLSFNFQGVENSEGKVGNDSLESRTKILNKIVGYIRGNFNFENLHIYGVSMGGFNVLDFLQQDKINGKVILHAPASYSVKAHNKRFGDGFTETIRTPNGWKNSESFNWLKNISNETLLIVPTRDDVIPKEILDKYTEIIDDEAKSQVYLLKNSKHAIWSNSEEDRTLKDEVFDEILRFIKQ
jgi:pimeloyl-ACP methyl ester carboxylesterase